MDGSLFRNNFGFGCVSQWLYRPILTVLLIRCWVPTQPLLLNDWGLANLLFGHWLSHQVANMKVPVSYMTDYLDVVRKDTYAMFSSPTAQSERLFPLILSY